MINLEKEFISNKLRIQNSELEKYFNLPLSSYKDYDNDAWLYYLGSKFFKFLGKEIEGNFDRNY